MRENSKKYVFQFIYFLFFLSLSSQMTLKESTKLIKWAKLHKIDILPSLLINPSNKDFPLPYFTTSSSIPSNTTIISIPYSLLITTKNLLKGKKSKTFNEVWKAILHQKNEHILYYSTKELFFEAFAISKAMVNERGKLFKKYKDYFEFYQYYSFDNFPIFYTKEEIDFLKHTNLEISIYNAQNSLDAEYEFSQKELKLLSVSKDEFLRYRVLALANSQNFNNETAIIPLIDLFKNENENPYVTWEYNTETNTIDIISIQEIPINQPITIKAKKIPNASSLLFYGYTLENNQLIAPYYIDTINPNLKERLSYNGRIGKEVFNIAKESFEDDIIDVYETISSKVGQYSGHNKFGAYELMRDNLLDYLKIYERFTEENMNSIFYSKRKIIDIKRVVDFERNLIESRINYLNEKISSIKSEL